jgi:membrane carboxypeptidase/penicillin-binding protein PbpC
MENNLEIKNSVSNLSFLWIAEFSDDCIFQIENGIEHRFAEVKDRFNELKYFTLQHKEKEISFTVDLVNGLIIYNNYKNIEVVEKKENVRLIYFRRNRITMTESGQEQSHQIWYFLGFQWLNSKKENRQTVLKIDENGNWVLGE